MLRRDQQLLTSDTLPHHLWYQRPLLAGEAVNYEFLYEPKLSEISPTLREPL